MQGMPMPWPGRSAGSLPINDHIVSPGTATWLSYRLLAPNHHGCRAAPMQSSGWPVCSQVRLFGIVHTPDRYAVPSCVVACAPLQCCVALLPKAPAQHPASPSFQLCSTARTWKDETPSTAWSHSYHNFWAAQLCWLSENQQASQPALMKILPRLKALCLDACVTSHGYQPMKRSDLPSPPAVAVVILVYHHEQHMPNLRGTRSSLQTASYNSSVRHHMSSASA